MDENSTHPSECICKMYFTAKLLNTTHENIGKDTHCLSRGTKCILSCSGNLVLCCIYRLLALQLTYWTLHLKILQRTHIIFHEGQSASCPQLSGITWRALLYSQIAGITTNVLNTTHANIGKDTQYLSRETKCILSCSGNLACVLLHSQIAGISFTYAVLSL